VLGRTHNHGTGDQGWQKVEEFAARPPAVPGPGSESAHPATIRRVVFCRDLLRLAENLRRASTDIARAESVIVLDASAEALLKTILDYAPEKSRAGLSRQPYLPELAGRVASVQGSPAATRSVLDHLHRVRNVVQHETTMVAASEVDGLHADVGKLLSELATRHLGISLTEVSLANLFKDDVARELFRRAESAQMGGKTEDSAVLLVAAFERSRFVEQQRLWGSMITWNKFFTELASSSDKGFHALKEYVGTLHRDVEVLKLRLDYKQYQKFCEIAPTLLTPHFGENLAPATDADAAFIHWKAKLTSDGPAGPMFRLTLEEGEWLPFAFGFVANAILAWQQEPRRGIFDSLSDGPK
jgi:hypothetical protein